MLGAFVHFEIAVRKAQFVELLEPFEDLINHRLGEEHPLVLDFNLPFPVRQCWPPVGHQYLTH